MGKPEVELKTSTCDSVILISLNMHIKEANESAAQLFGYEKEELLKKPISMLFPKKHEINLLSIINGIYNGKYYPRLTCKNLKKDGMEVLTRISIFPILNEDNHITEILFNFKGSKTAWIGDINDIESASKEQLKRNPLNSSGAKRTFEEIRFRILCSLLTGQRTINQLANDARINWKTVENHLTYLVGRDLVNEILKSEYVRIFELTPHGRVHISAKIQEKQNEFIDKLQNEEEIVR